MKSRQIRDQWREVLAAAQSGDTVVIEHYNRPIAQITRYEEPTMTTANQIESATEQLAGVAEAIRTGGIDAEIYGAVGDLLERVASIVGITVAEASARSETAGHALTHVREHLQSIVTAMDMATQPVTNALAE